MTQEEIIALAHETGITFVTEFGVALATPEFLTHFANLVAAKEREACAQVCEEISKDYWMGDCQFEAATRCVAAIRARGEQL